MARPDDPGGTHGAERAGRPHQRCLTADLSRASGLGDVTAAVLLVAAGEVADEQYAARALAANSTSNVHVWVVPAAGHTKGLQTAPQDWERRVVTFLDESLQEG